MKIFNFFLPEETHKRFKQLAAKKEKSMRAILQDLIEKELAENGF